MPGGHQGFYKIRTAAGEQPGPIGALQERRELAAGARITGFECTISVPDVHLVADQARALGGVVLMEPTVIPGVGELTFVADPSGNVCGAMRFETDEA
jgi:hypothetical protein